MIFGATDAADFVPRAFARVLTSVSLIAFLSTGATAATTQHNWRTDWMVPRGFTLDVDTEGFAFPSAIAFVPEPGPDPKSPLYFVTELRGKIKVITRDRSIHTFAENFFQLVPPKELPDVYGEMGMAAVTLDPEYGYVFVSFLYQDKDKVLRNSIVRFHSQPRTFALKPTGSVSFASIFAADVSTTHQVGPMVIKGGNLYVGVGDGFQASNAQSPDFTGGKILRMTLDGKPVPGNPFYVDQDVKTARNYVWALGLRNPFSLATSSGRLFAADNGLTVDRFLEVQRGQNYGWDGTDWSLGMNAPMVFGPSVAPVQLAWLGDNSSIFPKEYWSTFFVALAGSRSATTGVAALDYDFEHSRMRTRPRQFLHYIGKPGALMPVGCAFGPDGLYTVILNYAGLVTGDKGVVLRVRYDPTKSVEQGLTSVEGAESIMSRMSCFHCHSRHVDEQTLGPPLDAESLVPRILQTLKSNEYRRALNEINAVDSTPHVQYRQARLQVIAAKGVEQARLWIKYRIMEPAFDRKVSLMPKLGLSESEAERIADYLVEGYAGQTGFVGNFKRVTNRLMPRNPSRRHIVAAFGVGLIGAWGLLVLWHLFRRHFARSPRLPKEQAGTRQ